jgi:hypothetical protein
MDCTVIDRENVSARKGEEMFNAMCLGGNYG